MDERDRLERARGGSGPNRFRGGPVVHSGTPPPPSLATGLRAPLTRTMAGGETPELCRGIRGARPTTSCSRQPPFAGLSKKERERIAAVGRPDLDEPAGHRLGGPGQLRPRVAPLEDRRGHARTGSTSPTSGPALLRRDRPGGPWSGERRPAGDDAGAPSCTRANSGPCAVTRRRCVTVSRPLRSASASLDNRGNPRQGDPARGHHPRMSERRYAVTVILTHRVGVLGSWGTRLRRPGREGDLPDRRLAPVGEDGPGDRVPAFGHPRMMPAAGGPFKWARRGIPFGSSSEAIADRGLDAVAHRRHLAAHGPNSRECITTARTGVVARTVAVRRSWPTSAISPKKSPGPRSVRCSPSFVTSTVPSSSTKNSWAKLPWSTRR